MNLQDFKQRDERLVRKFEYDDRTVYAVDLGVGDGTVEVVGDTAIVIVNDEQHDVTLPEGDDVQAFIRNGVLTIEVTPE